MPLHGYSPEWERFYFYIIMENIYDLKLHEVLNIKIGNCPWKIIRVASGWIYQDDNPRLIVDVSYFVPFDNAFQEYNKLPELPKK